MSGTFDADLWQGVEERGTEALMSAQTLAPPLPAGYMTEWRFWHFPAFRAYISWTIFAHHGMPDRIIRRVVWDRAQDMNHGDPLAVVRQRVASTLTLAVKDRTITTADWAALSADLTATTIPPLAIDETVGLDGDHWGVARPGSFNQIYLQWWEAGPPAWEPLTERVRALLARLDASFDVDDQAIP